MWIGMVICDLSFWSRFPDLNWGPSIYKIVALPTELKRQT